MEIQLMRTNEEHRVRSDNRIPLSTDAIISEIFGDMTGYNRHLKLYEKDPKKSHEKNHMNTNITWIIIMMIMDLAKMINTVI